MLARFLRQPPLSHRSRQRRTIQLALEHLEERCLPAIIQVGPSAAYQTIAQAAAVAQNGDTIQIQAGTYTSQEAVFRQNNLTIEGVGGMAVFNDSGYALQNLKGIFDIQGNNVTVKNIECDYAHDTVNTDDNWAGIRGEGNTLTIENCTFLHNDDGILINNDPNFTTDNDNLMVASCEFGYNGFGDGQSHNMYIGEISSFTLEYSYSHDANQGHLVKSRALNTYLLYNYLVDGPTGGGSSEVDIPYGGDAYLVGNIIEKDAGAANHNFVTFDLENGPSTYAQQLYAVNNTFVNDYGGGTYVVGNSGNPPTTLLENNIFAGGGTLSSVAFSNVTNLVSNNPGFVSWNPSSIGGNYQLAAGSAAINAGTQPGSANGFSLVPTEEYVAPLSSQPRPVDGQIDIGAYEYGTASKATPTIAWAAPAAITYGTALSATQLDASANVAGTFNYTPAAGTVLAAGTQTLNVTFTPTDTTDYTTASASVTLTVNKATPAITWATPAPITYGTALSATQLDATANVAGTFTYTPASGTVLAAGSQTLNVTFTPTDTTDYTTASASVTLTVNKATPAITWATPAAITYGTALSATQLDATANVAGTFTYTPAAGTVLAAGTQTLDVTFTPTDTSDYTTAGASVALLVNPQTDQQSTTTLTSSANPAVYGQAVTLTATVTGPAGSGTPTGSVIFMDGNNALGSAKLNSSGVAALNVSLTTLGTNALTAVYSGDANFTSSSAALSQTVKKDAATVALSSSAATSVYGQAVTFTATVGAASPGSGTPTGTVTFYNGTAQLGTVTLSGGVARLTTSALTVGSHTIKATYNGNADFTSASKSIGQTVKKDSTKVAGAPTAATVGQLLTLSATVTPLSPGKGTPTGTVTFKDTTTGQVLGTATLVNDTAKLTNVKFTIAGTHKVSLTYSGDGNDLASSLTLVVTVAA
jgi:hypothetical protein